MKRFLSILCVLLLLASLSVTAIAAPRANGTRAEDKAEDNVVDEIFRAEVLARCNVERPYFASRKLAEDPALSVLAKELAEIGIGKGATLPSGRKWSSHLDESGYFYVMGGAACNYTESKTPLTGAALVEYWESERSFRENLQYIPYATTGIGRYYDAKKGVYRYVQLFVQLQPQIEYRAMTKMTYWGRTKAATKVYANAGYDPQGELDYAVIGRLPKGTVIAVPYEYMGWAKFYYDGDRYGYVLASGLEKVTPDALN